MKRLASILCPGLLVVRAALAFAISTSSVEEPMVKDPTQVPGGWTDSGGETVASATWINDLPYTDSDNTCGHTHDYTAACGANVSAPDLFYRYVPSTNEQVLVSLCGSAYDTVLYVLENGVEIACNDDFCDLQSELHVAVVAGRTYTIGVSGYSTACGPYTLFVTALYGPCIPCPTGVQIEGEPACGPNYVDAFNGGCNSTPQMFQPVTCGVICGETGTYVFNGLSHRDTDWFYINTSGGGTFSGRSVEGYTLRLFTGPMPGGVPDCTIYDTTTGNCVESASISYPAGGAWLWAGPDAFTGIPCGSRYVVTITGAGIPLPPCGATATESSTWGAIKDVYR